MRRNINIFKAEFALFICVFYLHYVKRNIMELPLLVVVLFCFALVFLVGSNFKSDHKDQTRLQIFFADSQTHISSKLTSAVLHKTKFLLGC